MDHREPVSAYEIPIRIVCQFNHSALRTSTTCVMHFVHQTSAKELLDGLDAAEPNIFLARRFFRPPQCGVNSFPLGRQS